MRAGWSNTLDLYWATVGSSAIRTRSPTSAFRFDADAVIDRAANTLLAAQIPLRGLNGNVPEKKLYLLQFATRGMAQPGTLRRRSCGASRSIPAVRALPDHVPDGFLRQPIAPRFPVLVYPPEQLSGREMRGLKPFFEQVLNPVRHRYRPRVTRFALQIDDGPVVFPLLDVPEIQVHRLVPPKTACKQDGQERSDRVCLSTTANRARSIAAPLVLALTSFRA